MAFNLGTSGIPKEGLLGCWDPGSTRSFRGEPINNVLLGVYHSYGDSNGTYLKTRANTQRVFIPTVNKEVNARVLNFYNDYGGGSGNCCPNLFNYGTGGAVSVTGSTQYTYSIIYKTTTGYTHPNYMYRYEFNSANSYLTESGVHSDGSRTALGDGWYHAWNQFTTQPGASYLNTYFFHYEYATYNTVYLASAQLTLGNRVIPPQHHIFNVDTASDRDSQYNRNAIGTDRFASYNYTKTGGLMDISGYEHHGRMSGGPYYDSDGGGCLVFDGVDDGVIIDEVSDLGPELHTMVAWVKSANFNQSGFIFEKTTNGSVNTQWSYFFNGNDTFYYRTYHQGSATGGHDSTFTTSSYFTNNQWHHVVATYDGRYKKVYVNGTLASNIEINYGRLTYNNTGQAFIGVYGGGGYRYNGKISKLMVYNRAWTETEILNDYNGSKSRYGL